MLNFLNLFQSRSVTPENPSDLGTKTANNPFNNNEQGGFESSLQTDFSLLINSKLSENKESLDPELLLLTNEEKDRLDESSDLLRSNLPQSGNLLPHDSLDNKTKFIAETTSLFDDAISNSKVSKTDLLNSHLQENDLQNTDLKNNGFQNNKDFSELSSVDTSKSNEAQINKLYSSEIQGQFKQEKSSLDASKQNQFKDQNQTHHVNFSTHIKNNAISTEEKVAGFEKTNFLSGQQLLGEKNITPETLSDKKIIHSQLESAKVDVRKKVSLNAMSVSEDQKTKTGKLEIEKIGLVESGKVNIEKVSVKKIIPEKVNGDLIVRENNSANLKIESLSSERLSNNNIENSIQSATKTKSIEKINHAEIEIKKPEYKGDFLIAKNNLKTDFKIDKTSNITENSIGLKEVEKVLNDETTTIKQTSKESVEKEIALLKVVSQDSLNRKTSEPILKSATHTEFGEHLKAKQNFAPNLALRIQWMFKQALSSAEIMMDPPELGPLSVKVQQHNGDTSIIFQANHSTTKDLLHENLPRLREMLDQQGIHLGDASVEDQSNDSKESDSNFSDEQQTENLSQDNLDQELEVKNNQSSSHLLDIYS